MSTSNISDKKIVSELRKKLTQDPNLINPCLEVILFNLLRLYDFYFYLLKIFKIKKLILILNFRN